ncbi:hypothetical protein [Nocardia sp. NPDC005978]|uniref:ATP-grasp domain-containing protein n=1 Tax=unclassified Nocardia TaxID=2637762 RepID=UPI0033BAB693
MVTLIVTPGPRFATPYLDRIEGPACCVIPAGTEHLWVGVPVPLLTVTSWTDYSQLAQRVAPLPTVTRVIGPHETTTAAAGFLSSLLGARGRDWAQSVAFTDKAVMKRRLHEAGIPVARWAVVHSIGDIAAAADELGWPVVVKPRRGCGTLGTHRIGDAGHLRQLRTAGAFAARTAPEDVDETLRAAGVYGSLDSTADGFLVEQYIDILAEYTCDIVTWPDRSRITLVTEHARPLLDAVQEGQAAEHVTLGDDSPVAADVIALTLRALDILGDPHSPVHCEVFLTRDGDYVLGEIACREGGTALPVVCEMLFGVNTFDAGIDLALERELPTPTDRRYEAIATVALVPAHGIVRRVPARSELEALPGVLRAETRVRENDYLGRGRGSAAAAGYLFLEPDPRWPLEAQRAEIRALAEPLFSVEPEPISVP